MASKSLFLVIPAFLSLSIQELQANDSIGLRGIKRALNQVAFASAQLGRTGASEEIVKLEKRCLTERAIHIDQVTALDQVLEQVEMNDNSVFVKIKF